MSDIYSREGTLNDMFPDGHWSRFHSYRVYEDASGHRYVVDDYKIKHYFPHSPEQGKGVKHDKDKPRMDLIPPETLESLATILTHGANKYEERNWEKGMRWGRVYASLQRHLNAWWAGEDTDKESGLSHLDHAAACIAFLITYRLRNIGKDDRPLKGQKQD